MSVSFTLELGVSTQARVTKLAMTKTAAALKTRNLMIGFRSHAREDSREQSVEGNQDSGACVGEDRRCVADPAMQYSGVSYFQGDVDAATHGNANVRRRIPQLRATVVMRSKGS